MLHVPAKASRQDNLGHAQKRKLSITTKKEPRLGGKTSPDNTKSDFPHKQQETLNKRRHFEKPILRTN